MVLVGLINKPSGVNVLYIYFPSVFVSETVTFIIKGRSFSSIDPINYF